METYPIPPEYCLIISAFRQKGTLRGTALYLNTDPATLVRKFQKIASEYDLLLKSNNKWVITEKGHRIAQWLEESVSAQKLTLDEKPKIRIASFSWLAEQKMIPHFSEFESATNYKYNWLFKTLSSDLEQELISGRSEFVITGHAPNDPLVAFKKVSSYDWKVIIPSEWRKEVRSLKGDKLIEYLQTKPFVRLTAINPINILNFEVQNIFSLHIDGVIGIRSAVSSGLGWSCVPAMSAFELLNDEKILDLDIKTMTTDHISLWWLRSRKDSAAHSKTLLKWIASF